MRFRSGFPEKIGGWEKYTTTRFLGVSFGVSVGVIVGVDVTVFVGVGVL